MTQLTRTEADTLLQMLDAVQVMEELEISPDKNGNLQPEQRDAIIAKLETLYKEADLPFDADGARTSVDAAAKDEYITRYQFQRPEPSLATKAAKVYVNRGFWAKVVGIPAAGLAALTAGAIGINAVQNEIRLTNQEQNAEVTMGVMYEHDQRLAQDINTLESYPEAARLPASEKKQFDSHLDQIASVRFELKPILEHYCSDGTPEDDITRDNMEDVHAGIPVWDNILASGLSAAQQASGLVRNQKTLETLTAEIEGDIALIRASDPPAIIDKRANAAYQQAQASIKARDTATARGYSGQLSSLVDALKAYGPLSEEALQDVANLQALARGDQARQQSQQMATTVAAQIDTVDIDGLRATIKHMNDLEARMEKSYTLKVIGGAWRYANDNPSQRSYYLIVNAVDQRGNPVKEFITSGEVVNGSQDKRWLSTWGERVPIEVYERVGNDKQRDGVIDEQRNMVFGRKQRGYLEVETMIKGNDGTTLPRRTQLTEW